MAPTPGDAFPGATMYDMRNLVIAALVAGCPTAHSTPPSADLEPVSAAVRATYDAISGPAGERNWDRFRALFAAGALLVPAVPAAQGRVLTVDEFIEASTPILL